MPPRRGWRIFGLCFYKDVAPTALGEPTSRRIERSKNTGPICKLFSNKFQFWFFHSFESGFVTFSIIELQNAFEISPAFASENTATTKRAVPYFWLTVRRRAFKYPKVFNFSSTSFISINRKLMKVTGNNFGVF